MLWNTPERTPEQKIQDEELQKLLKASVETYNKMSPEEKRKMHEEQRASFVRGMMPYGHDLSLEECEERLLEVDKKIQEATCCGAYLSELNESAMDLRGQIKIKKIERVLP